MVGGCGLGLMVGFNWNGHGGCGLSGLYGSLLLAGRHPSLASEGGGGWRVGGRVVRGGQEGCLLLGSLSTGDL